MFKCEKCGLLSQPNEKQARLVTEIRKKKYIDGGEGFETVQEIRVHSSCVPKKAVV
jgi:hypothetical protein